MEDYFSEIEFDYLKKPNDQSDLPVLWDRPAPLDKPLEASWNSPGALSVAAGPEMFLAGEVMDLAKEAIRSFTEYQIVQEREETERRRIDAALEATKHRIDAQKEAFLAELNKRYDDRSRLYDAIEAAQAKAMENNDMRMVHLCLQFMLDVYKGNPVIMEGHPNSGFLT